MSTNANRQASRLHRLQVYLPENLQQALDKYIATEFSPDSRIVTAIINKALTEFLEKRGYINQQEEAKEQGGEE